MNRLIERCAMLDVHKSQVTACLRVPDGDGGRRQEIREFRTTTAGLITLADWLRSYAVTVVGMESTGVYWRAIYYLLEDEFECQLFNARHLRHVPGRKSDVQDAEWGCQLIEHGMVSSSFVPPRPLRELRDLVRYRKAKIQECGREVQRVEKTLQDARIKLSSVASGARQIRAADARRADLRHPRPQRAGRAGQRRTAQEDPRAARCAPRPLHRPPRAADRADAPPHRLPRRDDRDTR